LIFNDKQEPFAHIAVRVSQSISVITVVQIKGSAPLELTLPVVIHKAILHRPNLLFAIDSFGTLHIIRYNLASHTLSDPIVCALVRHPCPPLYFGTIEINRTLHYLAQFEQFSSEGVKTLVFAPPEFSMDFALAELELFELKTEFSESEVDKKHSHFSRLCQINATEFATLFTSPPSPNESQLGSPSSPPQVTLITFVNPYAKVSNPSPPKSLADPEPVLYGSATIGASAPALSQFVHQPLGRPFDLDFRPSIALLAVREKQIYWSPKACSYDSTPCLSSTRPLK